MLCHTMYICYVHMLKKKDLIKKLSLQSLSLILAVCISGAAVSTVWQCLEWKNQSAVQK